jgi:hypothetical protein
MDHIFWGRWLRYGKWNAGFRDEIPHSELMQCVMMTGARLF